MMGAVRQIIPGIGIAAFTAIVTVACGETTPPPGAPGALPDRPRASAFRAPASLPGMLTRRSSVLRFIPCGGAGEGTAIRDNEGEAERVLLELGDPARGIPVMLRLDGERLVEIRFAGPDGMACDRLPPAGDLVARGNEPFWTAEVRAADLTLRTPETPDGIVFGGGSWREENGRRIFDARRESEAGTSSAIQLTLEPARCADTMSGALYPWQAKLTRDGTTLDGCGLEGRSAMP